MTQLRSLLDRAKIEYRDLPLQRHAESEWEGNSTIKITIDKSEAGDVPCTIHELLHVQLSEIIRPLFDDELEEAIISGLEDHLLEKLRAQPRSYRWWRAETHRRIK